MTPPLSLKAALARVHHTCSVDGQPVSLSELTARSMNFTQHFRTPGLPTARLRATFAREFFVDFVSAIQPGLRDWAEGDDDLPEFVMELVRRSWPPPDAVVADEALLTEMIRFDDLDLAQALFAQEDSAPVRWVVNSIDEVVFSPADVTLVCGVGRADLRTAFQDF